MYSKHFCGKAWTSFCSCWYNCSDMQLRELVRLVKDTSKTIQRVIPERKKEKPSSAATNGSSSKEKLLGETIPETISRLNRNYGSIPAKLSRFMETKITFGFVMDCLEFAFPSCNKRDVISDVEVMHVLSRSTERGMSTSRRKLNFYHWSRSESEHSLPPGDPIRLMSQQSSAVSFRNESQGAESPWGRLDSSRELISTGRARVRGIVPIDVSNLERGCFLFPLTETAESAKVAHMWTEFTAFCLPSEMTVVSTAHRELRKEVSQAAINWHVLKEHPPELAESYKHLEKRRELLVAYAERVKEVTDRHFSRLTKPLLPLSCEGAIEYLRIRLGECLLTPDARMNQMDILNLPLLCGNESLLLLKPDADSMKQSTRSVEQGEERPKWSPLATLEITDMFASVKVQHDPLAKIPTDCEITFFVHDLLLSDLSGLPIIHKKRSTVSPHRVILDNLAEKHATTRRSSKVSTLTLALSFFWCVWVKP